MNTIRIPYNNSRTNSQPVAGAVKISGIIKQEYGLVHNQDYSWYWDSKNKNLVLAFNDKHESIASMIALRFMGTDLYEV